jgi:hypothetical protein
MSIAKKILHIINESIEDDLWSFCDPRYVDEWKKRIRIYVSDKKLVRFLPKPAITPTPEIMDIFRKLSRLGKLTASSDTEYGDRELYTNQSLVMLVIAVYLPELITKSIWSALPPEEAFKKYLKIYQDLPWEEVTDEASAKEFLRKHFISNHGTVYGLMFDFASNVGRFLIDSIDPNEQNGSDYIRFKDIPWTLKRKILGDRYETFKYDEQSLWRPLTDFKGRDPHWDSDDAVMGYFLDSFRSRPTLTATIKDGKLVSVVGVGKKEPDPKYSFAIEVLKAMHPKIIRSGGNRG